MVELPQGKLEGVQAPGLESFRGIPYGAAPVGALRWQPPRAAAGWQGVKQATSFGPECPQKISGGYFAKSGGVEDCLTLNVYRPLRATSAKLPVMVWIYGGGLEVGGSQDYDPTWLVEQGGVVFVSINYRVGALGFLATRALDAEPHLAANYGLMDQQLALGWVQKNIARFGGDPGNVTIFGESAGGYSVYAHMASPLSHGLFQKAIVQSGGYQPHAPSLADGEAAGQEFAKAAGCADASPACLRALPVDKILSVQAKNFKGFVVDGKVLPAALDTAFSSGKFNHVPVLSGTNSDEATSFLAFMESKPGVAPSGKELAGLVKAFMPQHAGDVIKEYKLDAPGADVLALGRAGTAGMMACPGYRLYKMLAPFVPVYGYEFRDQTAPDYYPPAGFPLGAAHTFELAYIFTDYHGATGALHKLTAAQTRLATAMIHAWTSFAKSGKPDLGDGVAWPAFSVARPDMMQLQLGKPGVVRDFARRYDCGFWDRVQARM